MFGYENLKDLKNLKNLKDLCFTKQKIKTKNVFVKAVWGVLVAKMRWQSIKKIVWALMEHNL